jgi:transposase-like protein
MNYFKKIQNLTNEEKIDKTFEKILVYYEMIQEGKTENDVEIDQETFNFIKENYEDIDLFELYRDFLEIYLRTYRGVSKKAYVYYSNYIQNISNFDDIKTIIISDAKDFLEIIPELLIKYKKTNFTFSTEDRTLQKITKLMQNKYQNILINEIEKYDLVISYIPGLAYKISSFQIDQEFEKYVSEKRKNISKEIIWNYQKSKKHINILTEPNILKDEYNFTTKEFIKNNLSIQKIIDYSYWNVDVNVKEKMFFEMTTDPSEQNKVIVGNSESRKMTIEYEKILNNYHLSKYDNIRPIKNYEEYLKGFETVKKLKEIGEIKFNTKRMFFGNNGDKKIKIIDSHNIKEQNGMMICSYKDKNVSEKIFDMLNFVEKGDIIIPRFGSYKQIIKIDENQEGLACSPSLVIFRIKDQKNITPDYVLSIFQTEIMRNILKTLTYNRLIWTINPEELSEIKIPIVSIEKQKEFTEKFLQTKKENRKNNEELERLVRKLKGA